jgi:class 3 adenylate cyclase
MFCDMVGSSALSTRLDPEEQGDVIAAFHDCCANEIKSLGGMVAQYLGDGVLAYFGYPTAHENDAERAILAGLAILNGVGTLKAGGDVAVQARIAIGSGVVVVGDLVRQSVTQENAAIGATTNLVARLQPLAEPNSIVISPVTHRASSVLSSTIVISGATRSRALRSRCMCARYSGSARSRAGSTPIISRARRHCAGVRRSLDSCYGAQKARGLGGN